VDSAGPRVREHVIGTPLDDRDVDLRQRQLGRQHHPRRTASGDDDRMLRHRHPSLGYVENDTLLHPSVSLAAADYAARLKASGEPSVRDIR
jgi:hypothetical protein